MINLSNPRLSATIENWPMGFRKTATCKFETEHKNGMSRIVKTTTGKPKCFTYHKQVCLVDGDNGKIYILWRSEYSPAIGIWTHDAKTPTREEFENHYVSAVENNELFMQLNSLLNQANS